MRRFFTTAALVLLMAAPAVAGWLARAPLSLGRGQVALVEVKLDRGAAKPRLQFAGRRYPIYRLKAGSWVGVISPDLRTPLGSQGLLVTSAGSLAASGRVRVTKMDYGVRRITVSGRFMRLTPAQLAHHRRDVALQKAVYASYTARRLWRGAFVRPVPGMVTGNFGRESLVNGQPRSPHGGIDFRAAKGEPIKAVAAGRVALVRDTYFGGIIVLIDHGQGLISGYRHLDRALVKRGNVVAQGRVIGLVGMTGRVTGPHLHFDIHLGGARVDPLAWFENSRRLAALMGEK